MKSVSAEYKQDMAKLERNPSYVRIFFGNVDVTAINDGQWVSNGDYIYSQMGTLNYKYNYQETLASLEWNRWVLDGTQNIYDSENPTNDGWISSYVSDIDGNFSTAPTITRQFNNTHNLIGITIQFDTRTEECPVSVTVNAYNNNNLIVSDTQNPTSVKTVFELRANNVDKIEIIVNTALPYRRPRIEYVMYGIGMEYTDNDVVSCTQSHDIDPISRRLPNEKFEFTILDFEKNYDADNPSGIYEYVVRKSPCSISYGYTLDDDSIEWLKEDNYLLSGKPVVNNNQVTFQSTGLVGSLTDIYYKSQIGRKSFYDMATDVLVDANLSLTPSGEQPWVIDISLQNMYTTAVLPITTHMNCLQLISHACSCKLFTDDDNKIHIEPFNIEDLELEDFTVDFNDITKDTLKSQKIDELKAINIQRMIYTSEQRISTLYESTTEQTELHIEFQSIIDSSTIQINVSGGTLISSQIYGRAIDLELSSGTKNITITGSTITESTEVCTYEYNSTGETDKEENPLITEQSMCDTLAENVSTYLKQRNTYDLEYRGNPELETGDFINMQTFFSQDLQSLVLTDEIYYNGTLHGKLKLKNIIVPEPVIWDGITFSSDNDFTLETYNNNKNWDGTIYYSTDTQNWTEWYGTPISSNNGKLYLYGENNTVITGDNTNYHWVLTGTNIECSGNIETLLDYQIVLNGNHPVMGINCYRYMFRDCTSLISAPELPAITLTERCYYFMFYGCTGLITPPVLPATTLANYCYSYMFYGCTNLTSISSTMLSATVLADGCYQAMFAGCTNLSTIPLLPALTLQKNCYSYMFSSCTNIMLSSTQIGTYQTAYRIPTTGSGTTATDALTSMFGNTGGTFTGTPTINTTYYTSNTVV